MINIILNGCNGRMGRVLTAMIETNPLCQVVCGFDIAASADSGYPVYTNPWDYDGPADVLIDFSNPKALETLLPYVKERKIPIDIFAEKKTGIEEEASCKSVSCASERPVVAKTVGILRSLT